LIDLVLSLAELCKTAIAGGSKVLEAYSKKKLSKEEYELLKAASKQGEFVLFSVDQIPGIWVRANGKDFCDNKDPAFAAQYLQAFRSLCERGYIVYEEGKLFRLTGAGFEKARSLTKD